MVAHERVEQVAVTVKLQLPECDELSVARLGGCVGGQIHEAAVLGEDGCRDEERDVGRLSPVAFVCCTRDDLGLGVPIVADQSEKQVLIVVSHDLRLRATADEPLTTTDASSDAAGGRAPRPAGRRGLRAVRALGTGGRCH
ncbi:hypothetical protein GCM10009826_46070 [Humibacillus xanthopallidus]